MSKFRIVINPFTGEVSFSVCPQCLSPSCYFACPLKDEALGSDEEMGARYSNEDKCTGCGMCIDACSFSLSRIELGTKKEFAFKCDLCEGREEGPICVEYCPTEALRFVPKNVR